MKSDLHIGIAGGGLLGRICAWRLAMAGYQVTLFEQGEFSTPLAAGWTAAGMISPLSELEAAEPLVFHMGMEGLCQWPAWIEQLTKQTKRDVGYREQGSIIVAHRLDANALLQFHQRLTRVLQDARPRENTPELTQKYSRIQESKWLHSDDIHSLEPHLTGQFQQGLLLQPEAHLHARDFLDTLLTALSRLGVQLLDQLQVDCFPGEIRSAQHSGKFDWVIDTRGTGAKLQLDGLRGVRGEVLIVETDEVRLNRPVRLLHPRYRLYVVPRRNQQFIIGATEIESEDYSPISLQSHLELSSALVAVNPAFAEARILQTATNCRPAYIDNLPKVKVVPGLITANGLFRHGYLLAPSVVSKILNPIEANATVRNDKQACSRLEVTNDNR